LRCNISEAEFEQLMQEYHQRQADESGETLALDGKTLRGTRVADQECGAHILSVYDGQNQRVVVQEAVDSKENEIVAAPKALERLPLAGKIVTGDAMYTQRAISAHIVERGGDYLWPV